MNPAVKILVLNWNQKDHLFNCLDSLSNISYENYSVSIIDNGSNDGSKKMIRRNFETFEIVSLDKNYGFSKGYNLGFRLIEKESFDYLLILNNDTVVKSNILNDFLTVVSLKGQNNIYSGKIKFMEDKNVIWSAGGNVNFNHGLIKNIGFNTVDANQFNEISEVDFVTGCCMFLKKENFQKLGGFDTTFYMYGEDVDLCLRARKFRMKSIYVPEIELFHVVSASIGGMFSVFKFSRKFYSFFKLHYRYGNLMVLPISIILYFVRIKINLFKYLVKNSHKI